MGEVSTALWKHLRIPNVNSASLISKFLSEWIVSGENFDLLSHEALIFNSKECRLNCMCHTVNSSEIFSEGS